LSQAIYSLIKRIALIVECILFPVIICVPSWSAKATKDSYEMDVATFRASGEGGTVSEQLIAPQTSIAPQWTKHEA